MAEFSSLNGYMVKDTTARNIAKGRNQAVAFVDYATMIETLNEFEKDEYRAGQNVYIGVVGVPDLWVYSVEDIRHTYEYVSDEDVVEKLMSNTTIQVGFFKLAMLEGQKVDLTTYDQKLAKHDDDIAEIKGNLGDIGEGGMTVHEKLDYLINIREVDMDVLVNSSEINSYTGSGYSKYVLYAASIRGDSSPFNKNVTTTNGTVQNIVDNFFNTQGTVWFWYHGIYIITTDGSETTINWDITSDVNNEVLIGIR